MRQFDTGEHGIALHQVTLGPPVPDPEKIICVGLNYLDHAAEARAEVPVVPRSPYAFERSRMQKDPHENEELLTSFP